MPTRLSAVTTGIGELNSLFNMKTAQTLAVDANGAHAHTFSVTSGSGGAAHSHTTTGTAGSGGAPHTHTFTGPSASGGAAHTHTTTGTAANGGAAHTHTITGTATLAMDGTGAGVNNRAAYVTTNKFIYLGK